MPRPIYSDEVQEIMGRIPGWVVRWGLSVIFSIFNIFAVIFVMYRGREYVKKIYNRKV